MTKSPRRGSAIAHLQALLDQHRSLAQAIETTLALLQAEDRATAAPRLGSLLADAVRLDQARVNGQGHGIAAIHQAGAKQRKRHKGHYARLKQQQRARSAAFLATFSTTKPRDGGANKGLGPLLRRGYLVRNKDGGYLRTAKAYVP